MAQHLVSGSVLDVGQLVTVAGVLSDLARLRSHILSHPLALAEDPDAPASTASTSCADSSVGGGGSIPILCSMARGIVLPDAVRTCFLLFFFRMLLFLFCCALILWLSAGYKHA